MGVSVVAEGVTAELLGKKAGGKLLLRNVDFVAKEGELTAIMGPSGSGKTTFLNSLSGRLKLSANVTGTISYGGDPEAIKRINDFSSYVMQEDAFLEYLTVMETLTFASRLRLPGLSSESQAKRVDEIIYSLGLKSCADVRIGGREFKGISGGQRKRVSIAVALLNKPDILFLDEPTSGLDGSLALDVVDVLYEITRSSGQTIVCTIHQPRSTVFARFDSLMLLRAGQVVYAGPAQSAVDYFASIGHVCPDDFNPPDFFLDLLSDKSAAIEEDVPSPLDDESDGQAKPSKQPSIVRVQVTAEEGDKLANAFAESNYGKEYLAVLKQKLETKTGVKDSLEGGGISWWFSSVWILYQRAIICGRRRPQNTIVSICQNVFLGILIGTIWWQISFPKVSDGCNVTAARNVLGSIMQLAGGAAFTSMDSGLQLNERRPLVNREAVSGLYKRSAALTANFLADGLFHYWGNIAVLLLLYWFAGYRANFQAFVETLFIVLLLKFAFWSYAGLIGSLGPNSQAVLGMLPLGNVVLFVTSGFQLADSDIPIGLIWIKIVNPIRYSFQTIGRVQLDPDYTNYLEDCMGFETPATWWGCAASIFAFGVVARIACYVATHYLFTDQGTQA